MIKPNELRIGNYVYDDDYKIATVAGISSTNGCQLSKPAGNGEPKPFDWYEVFPIGLNEDWLRRLGFRVEEKKFLNNGTAFKKNGFFIGIDFHYNSGARVFEVKYVHQLQNLFYSVMEEELASE